MCEINDLTEDFCEHDEYEVDILTGRAICWLCGETWYLSTEDFRRYQENNAKWEAEYYEMMKEEYETMNTDRVIAAEEMAKALWNARADEFNQWHELSSDEKEAEIDNAVTIINTLEDIGYVITRKAKVSELRHILRSLAMRGYIDLEAIQSIPDIELAKKYSPPFKDAVEGLDVATVFGDVVEERALGVRTLHSGMGLWLTEAEWPR
jgi:hypothetical protein